MSDQNGSIDPLFLTLNVGCKAASHRIFGDCSRDNKLKQVVVSPSLASDPGHLESAERLSPHKCSGNVSIQIEIPDEQFLFDAFQ